MNNLVFLVPHVASIFSLVLISYEEWITKIFIGRPDYVRGRDNVVDGFRLNRPTASVFFESKSLEFNR